MRKVGDDCRGQFVLAAAVVLLAGCDPAPPVPPAGAPAGPPVTVAQVCEVAARLEGVAPAQIQAETTLGDLEMDELDFVEFVMELEARFQVRLPDVVVEQTWGAAPRQWRQVTMARVAALVEQVRQSQR